MVLKIKQRKLLAIGGPREFEWLPDYGHSDIMVAMPMGPIRFNSTPDPTTRMEATYYRKAKLGDPTTHRIKEVYIHKNMSDEQAIKELKEYLLEQFINMEDVTD